MKILCTLVFFFYCNPIFSPLGLVEIKGVIENPEEIIKEINFFKNNPQIKGVLVRIESPGGSVAASQEIYEALKELKKCGKKIVVSMGNIAASGGYYVALPADVIVANPGTVTGSIGVIVEYPVVEKLLKKVGVDVEVIKSSEFKDILSPFRRPKEKEKNILKNVVMDIYDQFVEKVARERKIPVDSVKKIADGRIMSGREALKLGLVDSLGGIEKAKKILAKLCKVKEPVKLFKLKKKKSLLKEIIEGSIFCTDLLPIRPYPVLKYLYKL